MEALQLDEGVAIEMNLLVALHRRIEHIVVYLVCHRTDTVDTTDTLHQSGSIPWRIVVNDDVGTMQIDTFSKHIRGYHDVEFIRLLGIVGIKALAEEKPGDFAKVMDFHYDQVKLALESYRKVVRKVVDAESMENRKKDKSTNVVQSILRTMNRALNAVDAEKTVAQIKKLEQIVELGVFIGLNSSINSFNRQVKKQKPSREDLIAQIIDKIDELFERYNIPLDTDEERNEEISKEAFR